MSTFSQRKAINYLLGLSFFIVFPLYAATHTVTNNADSGAGSLRQLVNDADANDTIVIPSYVADIVLTSGQITVEKSLTIKGSGSNKAAISGNQQSRIFASTISNTVLTLDNLLLEKGFTTHNRDEINDCFASDGRGGAVCSNGLLMIKNSTFSNNQTTGSYADGGAVFSNQTVTVENSLFEYNVTEGYDADGAAVTALESTDANRFDNVTFERNTSGDDAGAIYVGRGIFNNCRFIRNEANRASGALFVSKSAEIRNSIFSYNQAKNGSGGALNSYYADEEVIITDSEFDNNQADDYGGAISANNKTIMSGLTVTNNQAHFDGGGIYGGQSLTQSTISNNKTLSGYSSEGGGVYGTNEVSYSVISYNQADDGGGGLKNITLVSHSLIYGNATTSDNGKGGGAYGVSTIKNSIIYDNYTTGEKAHGGGLSYITNLENSTVFNNYIQGAGSYGGGVDDAGKIVNSTIANNRTLGPSGLGGGVYSSRYYATISNSTIQGNSTKYVQSGGIYVANDLNIISSIISGNNQNGIANDCELGNNAEVTATYTLIDTSGQYGCNITANSDNHNLLAVDAQLAVLADNGCAIKAGYASEAQCVKTIGFAASSPAINAGYADNSLITDQRGDGYRRVADGEPDIGAFERQDSDNNPNFIFIDSFED